MEVRSATLMKNEILANPDKVAALRADPEGMLNAEAARAVAATPLSTDHWIYRLVVGFLGSIVIFVIVGTIWLLLQHGPSSSVPDGLIALGSAAVGALAGLLAPSPTRT